MIKASDKQSRTIIFIILGIAVLATGLLSQFGTDSAKYAPFGLIATGFILAFFRQKICMNSGNQSDKVITDFLHTLNFKPQSLLFCGVAFMVLGILLLINNWGQVLQ